RACRASLPTSRRKHPLPSPCRRCCARKVFVSLAPPRPTRRCRRPVSSTNISAAVLCTLPWRANVPSPSSTLEPRSAYAAKHRSEPRRISGVAPDAQILRPDVFAPRLLAPQPFQFRGDRRQGIMPFATAVALHRRPGAEIGEDLIECPAFVHAELWRLDFRKRERQCPVALVNQAPFGRPPRADLIVVEIPDD